MSNLGDDDSQTHILHLDMDAFFASVEVADNPDLVGKPVIVGGISPRSVVCAASYEARAYGVRSAMPMVNARRKCPHAIVLPVRHQRYRSVSGQVIEVIRSVTPVVEPISIDEAFLDVTSVRKLFGSPIQIATRLRQEIAETIHLPASIGIAGSKQIAKMASGLAKPNGMFIVPKQRTLDFLWPLPISMLWGVGEKTAKRFQEIGIKTIGDLAQVPLKRMVYLLGEANGILLHDLANGRDERRVETVRLEKSIGQEQTFLYDVTDLEIVEKTIKQQAFNVARSLRKQQLIANCVVIKLKTAKFETFTRSKTLVAGTNVGAKIGQEALALLRKIWSQIGALRLVGVRAEQLSNSQNGVLFEIADEGRQIRAEAAMDVAREKFGDVLAMASQIDKPASGKV